jgi:release factor glutamine methyltransferase
VNEAWTILKVLKWTQGRFSERGIETPRLDAEVLLAHILQYDRVALYTHFDQPLSPDELTRYRELIKRRLQSEPVAYLVGKKEFRSLELHVDARVLVPRPETETLVELALTLLADGPSHRIVDVATGSGAIALALKSARPSSTVFATDLSPDAAEVARANALRLSLPVDIRVGDLLAPVVAEAPFDLVTANLPYITTAEIPSLPPEVLREPRQALDGGPDGLTFIRRLITDAHPLLAPAAWILLELAADQSPAASSLLTAARYTDITITKDLAGLPRIISARKPT